MEILDRLRIKQFGKNQTLAQMHRVVKQCVFLGFGAATDRYR
jgi:hypothetical protein